MASRSCPQCGAVLPEAAGFSECDFCGAALHLGAPRGVGHEILRPQIARAEVDVHLERWLRSRDTLGRATVREARLAYLPFWDEPGRDPAPAAELAEPLPLPPAEALPFTAELAGDAEVVEARVPLASVLFDAAKPAPAGTRLVHVPFWRVAYRVGARDHDALVEAVSGRVVPLTFPAAAGERWLDVLNSMVMASLFVAVLVAARAASAGAMAAHTPWAWPLLVVAGPLAWVVLWATARWRVR
jgi:hypothetical protein